MHSRKRYILLIASAALLSGCISRPTHRLLPEDAKTNIRSTEVVLAIPQNAIEMDAPESAFEDVFLYLDPNDSPEHAEAERALEPLRSALAGFSFDATLRQDMKAAFSNLDWLHAVPPRTIKDASDDNLDSVIAQSPAKAVFIANAHYELSADADRLTITANAYLFPKSHALLAANHTRAAAHMNLNDSLYHNTIVYKTMLPLHRPYGRAANLARLAENNAARMRLALQYGAAKIAELLADDINQYDHAPDAVSIGNPSAGRKETGVVRYTAPPLL